jgi:thiamine biosynthesis lipoprotein
MKVSFIKTVISFLMSVILQNFWFPATFAASEMIISRARPMLHTFVEIKVYGNNADEAIEAAFAEMERVNALLNNYNPKSEIAKISRHAGGDPVYISAETLEVLELAKHYGNLSGGAIDITIGPLLTLWGFGQDEVELPGNDPDPDTIRATKLLVDFQAIELSHQNEPGLIKRLFGRFTGLLDQDSPAKGTARLKHRNMWIDVGSLSKGYIADKAMNILKKRGIRNALIAAGGTICTMGHKPDLTSWQVGIQHPRKQNSLLAVISLKNKCVSTSGDYEIFYTKNDKRRTHIIDPRNGAPVERLQSVSVIAPNGISSDALSTALFVLGPEQGIALINSLSGTEAMIVSEGGNTVFSTGWPEKHIEY